MYLLIRDLIYLALGEEIAFLFSGDEGGVLWEESYVVVKEGVKETCRIIEV